MSRAQTVLVAVITGAVLYMLVGGGAPAPRPATVDAARSTAAPLPPLPDTPRQLGIDEAVDLIAADVKGVGPTLILTFVTAEYHAIVLNWLIALDRLALRGLPVCFDRACSELFEAKGIAHHFLTGASAMPDGWAQVTQKPGEEPWRVPPQYNIMLRLRMQFVMRLLRKGVNVVMSDADAVWVRNPMPYLFRGALQAMAGRYPKNLAARWPLGTVNCGLMSLRAGPTTEELFRKLLARMGGVDPEFKREFAIPDVDSFREALPEGGDVERKRRLPDDQVALNTVLYNMDIAWAPGTAATCRVGNCTRGVVPGGDLDVVLMDSSLFATACRREQITADSFVIHASCTRKHQDPKIQFLRTMHAWLLRDDFEQRGAGASGTAYLRAVSTPP